MMWDMRMRIAEVAYRKKGWTMKQVSEHLKVDHQTVMYWNQGRSLPRLPVLVRLCRLLGCGLDEMIEG